MCRGLLKRDENGQPTMFAGVVTCLERKGKIDSVTGLFTHDECMNLIDRLIACESQGGVMLLGLDDFSRINLLNGQADAARTGVESKMSTLHRALRGRR